MERFRTEKDRAKVRAELRKCFETEAEITCGIRIDEDKLRVGFAELPRIRRNGVEGALKSREILLKSTYSALESLMICVQRKWIPVLVGFESCGKTSTVKTLADLLGRKLISVSLSEISDTSELLGSFEQTDAKAKMLKTRNKLLDLFAEFRSGIKNEDELRIGFEIVQRLQTNPNLENLSCLKNFLESKFEVVIEEFTSLTSTTSKTTSTSSFKFEWIDSDLVEAVKTGKWLLIDNANSCPASVLDRLNGLFEDNGVLVINEAGGERVIEPHPEFRVFLTVNPRKGELSKAMRNRCLEIFIQGKFLNVSTM